MLLHIEGNLLLVQLPTASATGINDPGALAVVRLPADCAMQAPLTTGEQVEAIGMPTTEGILDPSQSWLSRRRRSSSMPGPQVRHVRTGIVLVLIHLSPVG
jgi:hypothetical protein